MYLLRQYSHGIYLLSYRDALEDTQYCRLSVHLSIDGIHVQVRLQHGDRLVLGPARLVCIYVAEPLTLAEKTNWTYDFALNEARSNKAWELLSPARRAAAESLASVREEQVMCGCAMMVVEIQNTQ